MNPTEYDTMYRQETDHWWYRGLRAMIDLAFERIPADGPLRVLDAGCGTGANAVHLHGRHKVFCVDYSELALDKCHVRGLDGLVHASATEAPFRAEAFDAVTMLDLLQHQGVIEPRRAIEEAFRIVRSKGHVIVNVPAYEWLRSRHDCAVHTTRRFTRSEVRGLLQAAGFQVRLLTYWNSMLLLPVAVSRKLSSHGAGSDIERRFGAPIERAFGHALVVERAIIRHRPLPFGVSIFALAQKPGA